MNLAHLSGSLTRKLLTNEDGCLFFTGMSLARWQTYVHLHFHRVEDITFDIQTRQFNIMGEASKLGCEPFNNIDRVFLALVYARKNVPYDVLFYLTKMSETVIFPLNGDRSLNIRRYMEKLVSTGREILDSRAQSIFINMIAGKPGSHGTFPGSEACPELCWAIGAIDAKKHVVAVNHAVGRFDGVKHWFTKKGEEYCIKSQALVSPLGLCISAEVGYYGCRHDFRMFKHTATHMQKLLHRKDTPGQPQRKYFSAIYDPGYTGVQKYLKKSLLMQKPSQMRTDGEKARNHALSHHRILVENFFGRLHGTCTMMRHQLRTKMCYWSAWIRICYAIANWNILEYPLRAHQEVVPPPAQDLAVLPADAPLAEVNDSILTDLNLSIDSLDEVSFFVDAKGDLIRSESNRKLSQQQPEGAGENPIV